MFLVLALLAFFAIALPDAMLGVAWPFMRTDLDQPLAALTLVLPLGVAATVVSATGWTWGAARIGLGRLLAGSVALSAVALLGCALAPAYWVVVACAIPFGLSAGAIDAALNAYAARHFGARQVSWMHAAYGIGAATSPLVVTGAVTSGTGWRAAYLVVMAVEGLLAVLFAVTARRWTEAAAVATPEVLHAAPTAPRRRWRPHPPAVTGLLVTAVDCGLESVVGLWAFVFLLEEVALGPGAAGVVVSGYWVALVAGRIVLGPLAERVGTWPVLVGSTVLAVVAGVLVGSAGPDAVAVGVVLLGVAVAPVYPLLVLTTAERTTAESADRLVGYQAAAATLGSVSCVGLTGLVMSADPAGFAYAVLVLALLTGAGLLVLRPGVSRPARPE